MRYLLDTDIVADFLAGRPQAGELFPRLLPEGAAICVISYLELLEGIGLGRDTRQRANEFRRLLKGKRLIAIGRPIGRRAAVVGIDLRRRRRQVNERARDILIAATAIEHDLTLVPRNRRDYEDISGPRLFADLA